MTAAPTASFDISDATTYTRGVVTWNDRSVTVTGEHSSPSADDCRATWVCTFDIARNRLGSTVCLDDHDLNDLKCDSFSKP
ncbi:hypothetical protein [Streptomyces sp. NEAU-YJ-81]|uniref:hypothetical protein n=1 Tax=Streptomyces sp. NEAU-YJ-81 TaxID=2820288 RepID=UPI001ABC4F7A|nr:hypothetical protein [Streptomyces sp. NEAU-YJ-81]MBO3680176.1 hypothetical protein [Streptomyces sp. NEAU-YJ-81]